MTPLFLDTGFLIALESADDQHHRQAIECWQQLKFDPPQLIITSYVFCEVVTFFNVRSHHAKAVEIGDRLLHSKDVKLVQVDESLLADAWRYFARHRDKRYSLTDCISFLVMKRLKIKQALAFDQHFSQAGFERLPK
jgi:uncharacterized protein